MNIIEEVINLKRKFEQRSLIGEVKEYAGMSIPEGWLACDGSEVLKSDYPELYSVIGDLWGTASDSNHFKLPDKRGKVGVGYDTGDSNFNTIGKTGGSKDAIIVSHNHSTSFDGEYFVTTEESSANNTRVNYASSGNRWVDGQSSQSHFHHRLNTGMVGSSGTGKNLQPYVVLNYIICAK